jgi:hypothetical protein
LAGGLACGDEPAAGALGEVGETGVSKPLTLQNLPARAAQGQKKSTYGEVLLHQARAAPVCFCGLQRYFFQHFDTDFALGNLAQGGNARLVFALNLGCMALAEHAGTVAGGQHQLEAIRDLHEAIFNGNAGHGVSSFKQ